MHTCRRTQQYLDVGVGFQWSEFHILPIQSMQPLLSLYANSPLYLSHDHHPPSVLRLFLVSLYKKDQLICSV